MRAEGWAVTLPEDSAHFVRSGPSHNLLRPLRELVSCGPLPLPECGGAHASGSVTAHPIGYQGTPGVTPYGFSVTLEGLEAAARNAWARFRYALGTRRTVVILYLATIS